MRVDVTLAPVPIHSPDLISEVADVDRREPLAALLTELVLLDAAADARANALRFARCPFVLRAEDLRAIQWVCEWPAIEQKSP